VIYLDNAATSFPKAPGVAEAVAACLRDLPGSPGRASHGPAVAASRLLFDLRERMAAFFAVADSSRLVFTKGATEAINLALYGILKPGARVLVSPLEHNAVMRPLRWLEARHAVRLEPLAFSRGGLPDFLGLERQLASRPDLLVVLAASNVNGAVIPVQRMAYMATAAGVPILVDASQLVGHRRVDFSALGLAMVAFSGHKGLLGPAGTGCLYIAPGLDPEPLLRGGTGSRSESEEQPDFLPDRYEAGTQNLASLAGLGAAVDHLSGLDAAAAAAREKAQRARLVDGLEAMAGMEVYRCDDEASALPVVAATCLTRPDSDLAADLDRRGVAVRMGLHCAPAAHRHLGSHSRGGCLRLSPGPATTDTELDEALSILEECIR
jgi:cysteine desulfurase family protein